MRSPRLPFGILCFSTLVALGFAAALDAQDTAAGNPAQVDTTDAQTGAAGTDDTNTEGDRPQTDWERLVYVPYRQLKGVLDQHGATAFMPYGEYLKLWQSQQPQKPDKVQAVITEIRYSATVDGNLARIRAKLTVQVFGEPWVRVPIQFGDAAIGKLTSESKVLLQATGNGTYALLFGETGEQTLELELSTRVRTAPEGNSLSLTGPTAGITTFELAVPQPDQSIVLTPDVVTQPIDAPEGETRIQANLSAVEHIVATWHPKTGRKPEMELLTAVENHLVVSIQDGLVHTDAFLHYDILRGELQQLQIALPEGHRILGVSSSDVRIKGWRAQTDANRQVVTVELLAPASKGFMLEVHTEREQPDGVIDVAGMNEQQGVFGIHSLDAIRESGFLVVTAGSDLSLTIEDQQGLIRVEADQVPQAIQRSSALSYRFYSPRFLLQVSAKPVEPRITVDQFTQLVLRDDELRLTATLNYTVERAGVFELELTVPEGLVVEGVSGNAVKEHTFEAETRRLRVALREKQTGSIGLTIQGHRPFDGQTAQSQLLLPILEPQSVVRETGRVQLYAPAAIEVISDEEQLIAAQPEPAAEVARIPNARFAAAWTYNRRPVQIGVRTNRKPTRLTAHVGTTVNIKQSGAEVTSQVRYSVEYAGLDTFRVSVPEAVADAVQIQLAGSGTAGAAIKQRTRADAVDGRVIWTVVMQRPVEGALALEVKYDLAPLPADQPDADAVADNQSEPSTAQQSYRIEIIEALGLEAAENRPAVSLSAVTGEIAVLKDRALAVSAEFDAETLEAIDVRELSSGASESYLAYRYFTQPVELTLHAVKHEIQEVVETVLARSLVEIVLSKDNRATYRARYVLKSSERQRLRIDWPAEAELLGLYVDNNSVNPELNEAADPAEGYEAYFVNVARTAGSDAPFTITLLFALPLGELFEVRGGRIDLPLPIVGGTGEQTVAVQELRTAVWVPEEYALVGTPENFVRARRYDLEDIAESLLEGRAPASTSDDSSLQSWIGGTTAGLFDFPTQGRQYVYRNLGGATRIELVWSEIWFWTVVLSGAFLVIGWVLRRTPWENKLSILLLLTVAASLAAIRYDDWVLQGLMAARWGLLALLVLWIIFGLANVPAMRHAGEAAAGSHRTAPPPADSQDASVPAVTPPPENPKSDDELTSKPND